MGIFVRKRTITMKKILYITLAAFLLPLFSCTRSSTPAPSFDEVVSSRRSIRAYDPSRSVSREQIRQIVACAQEAPSWANVQSTRYYAVTSPENLAALKDLIGESNKKSAGDAPVLLVSTYVKGQSGFFRAQQTNELGDTWGAYDNGLSSAFLILKARELGLDTLIMGLRDSDRIRELLGISNQEEVTSVIALGYRLSDPARPERKPLEDILKFM